MHLIHTRKLTKTKNTMSTYDIIYKGLSDLDRAKMQSDLEGLMAKAIENSKPRFNEIIGKAVRELCDQVGFWGDWVKENGGQYEFVKTLREGIWKSILATKPVGEVSSFELHDLIEAWRTRFPQEWAEVVSEDAQAEIKRLTEALELEQTINRH